MKRRYLELGIALFTFALSAACGSSDKAGGKTADSGAGATAGTGGVTSSSGGATASNSGGTTSSGGAVGASGGAESLGCNLGPCQNKTALGQALTACCQSNAACGVTFGTLGGCFDPKVIPSGDAGFLRSEPIVSDPKCKGITFAAPDGGAPMTLPGCCDKSNVCGFSTGNFGAVGGFKIPAQCITPVAVRQLSGQFGQSIDAGASVSCNYPDGG